MRGGTYGHAGAPFPIDGRKLRRVTVLTDHAIVEARAEMIRGATQEIWLSSYIWRDAKPLTDLLVAKAKIPGGVHVIISSGPCRSDRVQERIQELLDAGVHVYCRESSHSKCVVVDGVDVLLGSANVDRSHRDLSLRAHGAELAKSVREYLLEVSRHRDRTVTKARSSRARKPAAAGRPDRERPRVSDPGDESASGGSQSSRPGAGRTGRQHAHRRD